MPTSVTKWADSHDVLHNLNTDKRLSTGEAAVRLGVCVKTVLNLIRRRQLYPVCRHNERRIEIYECAVNDYLTRKTSP